MKLIKDLFLKKENTGTGVLFSLSDDSKSYIKLSGLALEIVDKLLNGGSEEEIKKKILSEYDVTPEQLDSDFEKLYTKIKEVGFSEV